MGKNKKHIPKKTKDKIWKNNIYLPDCPEFTQCFTCENFVLIPSSIRKLNNAKDNLIKIIVNGKEVKIQGTAEFGHIISEKNGGSINEDNLIIQCKKCNTIQSSKNIDPLSIKKRDQIMIDKIIYQKNNINKKKDKLIQKSKLQCCNVLKNGLKCKNHCIVNRKYCSIHLVN